MNEISITYSAEEILKMIDEIKVTSIFALILDTFALVACCFIIIKAVAESDKK